MMGTRLLFVIGNLDVGGAERHLLQILPALKARGFEPSVCTLSWKGVLAPEFIKAGIPVYSPPFAESIRKIPWGIGQAILLVISQLRYYSLILKLRPAVVHFFLPEAYIVGGIGSLIMPGLKLKRVMSRRSLDVYQLNHPYLARVERWLHKRMDAVLGNSRAVVEQLEGEGVAKDRLGLIYNGLDLSQWDAPVDRAHVREELGVAQDSLVLILVANLIPYKGHEDLIRALALAKDALPQDWTLLCIGRDTGIGQDLKALAQELAVSEHIHWMGTRHDVARLLEVSDIGLLCSHQEGFSNSILEGMAASLPMIVTEVGGNGEAVVDSETGLVVPPHTPEALANAIAKLSRDREKRMAMGKAGRARVEQLFARETCVEQYQKLYTNLFVEGDMTVAEMIAAPNDEGAA